MKNNTKYFFSFFILNLFLQPLIAQDIRIIADEIVTILTEGREKTTLTGNVRIERESKIMLAEEAIIEGEDNNLITFNGNIRLSDSKNQFHLEASSLQFDTDNSIIIARGTIHMEDQKNDVILDAQYLSYDEDNEKITLQNSIQFVQDDLTVTAEYATYWKEQQILELSGLPRVQQKKNTFEALFIRVNLENDEITLEGRISGNLISDDEEDSPVDEEQ